MKHEPRILILSGPMGTGHHRAALALCKTFSLYHPDCTVIHRNTTRWMPLPLKLIFLQIYPFLLRHFQFGWKWIHGWNNFSSIGIFPLLLDLFSAQVERFLMRCIAKNHVDLLVCVHFFPARVIAGMKRNGHLRHLPSAVVVTDHAAHRIYANLEHDILFVPNAQAKEKFAGWGIPEEQICIAGCPLFPQYRRCPTPDDCAEYRRELGLDADLSYVLLTMGGWAVRNTEHDILELLESRKPLGILAMTGINHSLQHRLEKIAAGPKQDAAAPNSGDGFRMDRKKDGVRNFEPAAHSDNGRKSENPGLSGNTGRQVAGFARHVKRLHPIPYTDKIYQYMSVADVVVTKPGGITTSECIALQKPMLLVAPIAGHEEENMKILLQQKIADSLHRHESLADAVERVQKNAEKMAERMPPYAEKAREGSMQIAEQILALRDKADTAAEKSPLHRKSRKFFLLSGIILCLLCGCAPVLTEETECHTITAGHDGSPVFFDCADKNGTILRKAENITLEHHLSRMSRAMEKSGRSKILIYCFGGMNSVNDTVQISAENTPIIMNSSDMYPIFVNWESELFECYFYHLVYVRQGVENTWFGPPLVPFYFLADTAGAVCRLPIDMIFQSAGGPDLQSMHGYNEAAQTIRAQRTGMRCYLGSDNDPHTLFPLVRLGYFAGFPFRVFTTSLIKVFAPDAWQEMRRRARLAFDRDKIAEGNLNRTPGVPDGVLSRFAEMLHDYSRKHPETEITLVGHSMGSFLATEFLFRYPELPVKNIVFMASASGVQETVQVVKPYLEKKREAQFYNLCVHPFIEWYDMMDYCVLPCGSILSWVSQHLTNPVSREEHPVGIWDVSVYLLPRLMKGVEKQVTIKAFGLNDPVTNTEVTGMPRQHTDFSDPRVKFWQQSFWEIPPQTLKRHD